MLFHGNFGQQQADPVDFDGRKQVTRVAAADERISLRRERAERGSAAKDFGGVLDSRLKSKLSTPPRPTGEDAYGGSAETRRHGAAARSGKHRILGVKLGNHGVCGLKIGLRPVRISTLADFAQGRKSDECRG